MKQKTIEISQRHDGRYNVWHFTADPTCDTVILDEDNRPFVYKRWIIKGVFDEKEKAQKFERELLLASR